MTEETLSPQARFAVRRLHRDWKELEQEKESLPNIRALPTSDFFAWHCNLRPDCGPFAGVIFHLVLRFPEDYPHSPPDVQLCSYLSHPNVFKWRVEGFSLCLDMLQSHYTSEPYVGWTSAYSLLSIVLQLQSFLFAENIPQNNYRSNDTIYTKANRSRQSLLKSISDAKDFRCKVEAHDGVWVTHTHDDPWPPLPTRGAEPTPSKNTQRPFLYKASDFPPLGEDKPATETLPSPSHEPHLIKAATTTPTPEPNRETEAHCVFRHPLLPSEIYANIFSFLDPKGLLRTRDVCHQWRKVVVSYNLFERSQIQCFHSKATLDDYHTILGVGLKVEYYPDGNSLKSASSPLDLLSQEAFDEGGVPTGVWGGREESFNYFLPLILNYGHAARAVGRIEETIRSIMRKCAFVYPKQGRTRKDKQRGVRQPQVPFRPKDEFPVMTFQLLATLMNSMVVELMNSTERRGNREASEINRHASEKALDGYCAFHHMLLYFGKRRPQIIEYANLLIDQFLASEDCRHKRHTPNLGILLICLTLSQRGWDSLRKPLVLEAFDRNVRWLLKRHPRLASVVSDRERLELTFLGARTSLRLLMFQTYFMSKIGRPAGTRGPLDVLDCYEKQMGKPTTSQKEELQKNAKAILAVTTWPQFFARLGGPIPTTHRLLQILKQAEINSERKKYHRNF